MLQIVAYVCQNLLNLVASAFITATSIMTRLRTTSLWARGVVCLHVCVCVCSWVGRRCTVLLLVDILLSLILCWVLEQRLNLLTRSVSLSSLSVAFHLYCMHIDASCVGPVGFRWMMMIDCYLVGENGEWQWPWVSLEVTFVVWNVRPSLNSVNI